MYDTTEQILIRAYDLIQTDQIEDARTLLEPVLENDADNVEAWWLYAHAVTDIESANKALDNVIRLDSNYPGAAELKRKVTELIQAGGLLDAQSGDSVLTLPPQTLPEDVPEDLGFDLSFEDDEDDRKRSRRLTLAVIAATIMVVGIVSAVAILIVTGDDSEVGVTPTAIAANTAQPTSTIAVDAGALTAGLNDEIRAILSDDFTLPANAISTRTTDLGETLVISVCTSPNVQQLQVDLEGVLYRLAQGLNLSLVTADAIGANMLDCSNNIDVRNIVVALTDAAAFAQGQLDEENFAARWRSF
ncbi:MAG: hypothetical protein CUN54_00475 [Phototrophicales bacterium]|nr:MAG: hypothetical protein CUN54_00475 [Phototrophicales bacterium]